MDILFNIVAGFVVLFWIAAAVAWPIIEERDRKRFNKTNVKYTDGDNT